MFRLLRYFSVTSLVSMILAVVVLGLVYRQIATTYLVELGESNNLALTQMLNNSMGSELHAIVRTAGANDIDALQQHPDLLALRERVVNDMSNTQIVKVQLYDLNGRTLFSTDPEQIGEDESQNSGFLSAREGQSFTKLSHRDQFSAFDGSVQNRDLLSSYIPLRYAADSPIAGVFEVYADVTDVLENINRGQRTAIWSVILVLGLLYGILFVVVRHADRIIKTQHQQQTRTELSLRESRKLLDRRVQERTAELEIEIAERRQAERQIVHMATHDALTGLPNRTLLVDRLEQGILYASRYSHRRHLTVVFIDLDHFKLVNDSLGHSVGDELLKAIADRLSRCVRQMDTVVRLGGDEFVVVLFDQDQRPGSTTSVLQKIHETVSRPIELAQHTLQITCSMGLATYPADGADPSTLLMNADVAMYRAKELGRDNYQFYTNEMNARMREKLELQDGLRRALAENEFFLVYQPQIDLRSGTIFGVEALLRWEHPELGLISPAEFIPLAEDSGLIVPIGDWVLHTACVQNKAWHDAGMPAGTMSVNVSARQFRSLDLASRVAHALETSGLEPHYLELELTESMIMHDAQQAVATMRELEAMGVKLAIDDFGTGYSSLSALKSFPLTRLKIDRSFMSNISTDQNDRAIAKAMIALGHTLNLKVIAEGVETNEQLDFLRANNCDEMQGYFFSKPVSAQEIQHMLVSPQKSASFASA